MSLRGRHVIDRIRRAIEHRFTLPCPPYGNPSYWDAVYQKLGPTDTYEWGYLTLNEHLMEYSYKTLLEIPPTSLSSSEEETNHDDDKETNKNITTTFGETIGVYPNNNNNNSSNNNNNNNNTNYNEKPTKNKNNNNNSNGKRKKEEETSSILLLGCGNSKLGIDMAMNGWDMGRNNNDCCCRIIHVDISDKVLQDGKDLVRLQQQQQQQLPQQLLLEWVQDDATTLSKFSNASVNAVIDKGLMDALWLANERSQMQDIYYHVHRILKPGGIFCTFSLSQPEFFLNATNTNTTATTTTTAAVTTAASAAAVPWTNVQVRALDSILCYRFQKNTKQNNNKIRKKKKGVTQKLRIPNRNQ